MTFLPSSFKGVTSIIISALISIAGMPPFGIYPILTFSIAPAIYSIIHAKSLKSAILLGFVWGCIFSLGNFFWVTKTTFLGWMLLGFLLALAPALWAGGTYWIIQKSGIDKESVPPIPGPLAIGFLWGASEWLRSSFPPFGWLPFASALPTPFLQIAGLGGSYLVSSLLVAWNASLALQYGKRDNKALLICGLLLVTSAIYGTNKINEVESLWDSPSSTKITVALANTCNTTPKTSGEAWSYLTNAIALHPPTNVQLVSWAEGTPIPILNHQAGWDTIKNYCEELPCPLLLTCSLREPTNSSVYNASLFLTQQGEKIDIQKKAVLIPAAEGKIPLLPKGVSGAKYSWGDIKHLHPFLLPIPTPNTTIPIGSLICLEGGIPQEVSALKDSGIKFLVVPSNTQDLGLQGEAQLNAMLILSASQFQLPILSPRNGGSAVAYAPGGVSLNPIGNQTTYNPNQNKSHLELFQISLQPSIKPQTKPYLPTITLQSLTMLILTITFSTLCFARNNFNKPKKLTA